jgi:hypothetical protein
MKVDGFAASGVATAKLISSSGSQMSFGHAQLTEGVSHGLEADTAYNLRIDLHFKEAAEVSVEIRLFQPDGSLHGTPHEQLLRGDPGDVRSVVAFLKTLQE